MINAEDLNETEATKLSRIINDKYTVFFSEGYSMEYLHDGMWTINDDVTQTDFDTGYFSDLIKRWGKLIGYVVK